jgi:hypothetical protein
MAMAQRVQTRGVSRELGVEFARVIQ